MLFPTDTDLKLLEHPGREGGPARAGIDHLLVVPFSRDFSRMKAFDYVRDPLVGASGCMRW